MPQLFYNCFRIIIQPILISTELLVFFQTPYVLPQPRQHPPLLFDLIRNYLRVWDEYKRSQETGQGEKGGRVEP